MQGSLAERAIPEHFHTATPLLESWALSQVAGTTVLLKCENVQPTGSFKIRGIGHFCQEVRVCGQEGRQEGVGGGAEAGAGSEPARLGGGGSSRLSDTCLGEPATPFPLFSGGQEGMQAPGVLLR